LPVPTGPADQVAHGRRIGLPAADPLGVLLESLLGLVVAHDQVQSPVRFDKLDQIAALAFDHGLL